jgi:hypothetical protein
MMADYENARPAPGQSGPGLHISSNNLRFGTCEDEKLKQPGRRAVDVVLRRFGQGHPPAPRFSSRLPLVWTQSGVISAVKFNSHSALVEWQILIGGIIAGKSLIRLILTQQTE